MNKDKIIEVRNRTYDIYRRFARKINDIDSNVIKVEIHYEMRFLTGVCPTKPLIDDDILNPDDKLFWYHKCLNPDCTGSGFYLTDEISEAIKSHNVVKGEKYCDGKEDWKYLDASGCSCETTLYYEIRPVFKQSVI